MKIHAIASRFHYLHHILPIFRHFGEGTRGRIYGTTPRGIAPEDVILVAGYSDIELAGDNRVIFLEHGAGQRYIGLSERMAPYYGGPYPENVIAYLGPRQETVDATGLPGTAVHAPICDEYELFGEDKVAAFTFHWKGARVVPEADSALYHYVEDLARIVVAFQAAGWEVLGHRHPKLVHPINLWSRLGIEEVPVDTVRRRASMLVSDNTSLAYEMAYLGRQNITLNCPKYRKDMNHGLRFWDTPPGPMVDSPDELIDLISGGEAHVHGVFAAIAAQAAYGKLFSDGRDGFRAAAWVQMLLSTI